MNKRIIAGGIAVIALGATALTQVQPKSAFDKIDWVRPTTDAAWAKDTLNENIANRSDKVLDEMQASQRAKLIKEKEADKKYTGCSECIYYDYYQQFSQTMDDATAQSEAHKAADTAIAQHQWEIEKISQSVERIEAEQSLRKKGFVTTDDSGIKFGGTTQKIVRHIID